MSPCKSSSSVFVWLASILLVISCCVASGSNPNGPENFSPAQLRVLHDLSSMLINAGELFDSGSIADLEANLDILRSAAPERMQRLRNNNNNNNVVMKRNSELLNSLLGLPKNILKSGRK